MIIRKFAIGFLTISMVGLLSGCASGQQGLNNEISSTADANGATIKENVTESVVENGVVSDNTTSYSELLDKLHNLLLHGYDGHEDIEGETGLLEAVLMASSRGVADKFGYLISDISGDNIPELIIAEVPIENEADMVRNGNLIYAVYTLVDNKPKLAFEGWSRSRYNYMGNGQFLFEGSNGAMYSMFGAYTISPDGTDIVNDDFYFTYEKDNTFENIGYYHNKTGLWDKSVSEELAISEDDFWKIRLNYSNNIQNINVTPFSEYDVKEAVLSAFWEEDVIAKLKAYDVYIADTASDYQAKVVFSVNKDVKDFKVINLEFESADNNGNIKYKEHVVYTKDILSADKPLMVGMTLEGSIPNYAVSYKNSEGETKKYTVEVSGMDGSLLLNEMN